LSGAYWEAEWSRWLDMAFLARYGHQSIPALLGRTPTLLELQIFKAAVRYFVELDRQGPEE